MVNPVEVNSNRLNFPVDDSPKYRASSKKEFDSSQVNVSLSEKAQGLSMFASDSPLIEVLQNEFNEVFECDGVKKDSFLKNLDHIFVKNGL